MVAVMRAGGVRVTPGQTTKLPRSRVTPRRFPSLATYVLVSTPVCLIGMFCEATRVGRCGRVPFRVAIRGVTGDGRAEDRVTPNRPNYQTTTIQGHPKLPQSRVTPPMFSSVATSLVVHTPLCVRSVCLTAVCAQWYRPAPCRVIFRGVTGDGMAEDRVTRERAKLPNYQTTSIQGHPWRVFLSSDLRGDRYTAAPGGVVIHCAAQTAVPSESSWDRLPCRQRRWKGERQGHPRDGKLPNYLGPGSRPHHPPSSDPPPPSRSMSVSTPPRVPSLVISRPLSP